MGKCERCGGDIAVMPTICWKCFYSFWNTTTPEQAELIKRIQKQAVDNFAEKAKERLRLHIECEYSDDEPEDWAFKNGMKWAIRELDQLTQQNEGEE